MKKIAVFGAGPSGLIAAKYCITNGYACDVYEQRGHLAGTWNSVIFDEEKSDDLHFTTLYEGVLTNIPKEIMMVPDFSYPPDQTKSFLEPDEVFNYFKDYADRFNIHPHIQYFTCVTNVKPNGDETWSVSIKKLKTNAEETHVYDAVFVCTGHLWYPSYPEIPGRDIFRGGQVHSIQYKVPAPFKDKVVVVVGARASGRDIASFISTVAKHVYVSYREVCLVNFEGNLSGKPPIKELREHSAVFEDGSEEMIDDIVYCTGFDYRYPFFSSECGITAGDKVVYPLYQHVVNINHTSMYIIGINSLVCAIPLFDLQIRFCMALLKRSFSLPSRETMLKELDDKMEERRKRGLHKRFTHQMAEFQEEYWAELARIAHIERLPPVLCRIYNEVRKGRKLECRYKIIDDENFEVY